MSTDSRRRTRRTESRMLTIGELSREHLDNRTGDHTPDGICILSGHGADVRGEAAAIKTADLAPSIARFFGIELRDHDGRPFELRA